MPTEYAVDAALERMVHAMINNESLAEFASLRKSGKQFAAAVRIRQNKEGEALPCKGQPVWTRKVSDLHKVWLNVDYVIVVEHSVWITASANSQGYLVHSGLRNVQLDIDASGEFKASMRKPDVQGHSLSIARFPTAEEAQGVRRMLTDAPDLRVLAEPDKKSAKKEKK